MPTLAFMASVAAVYAVGIVLAIRHFHLDGDRLLLVADAVWRGRLDAPGLAGSVDSVEIGGRYYLAVGPLQLVPYLVLAPLGPLRGLAPYLAAAIPGILAAWLSLPLARAYGAERAAGYWIAAFVAFGSLLMYVSVLGDFYYLAHAESFLALVLALLEWRGRRRPIVLGACFALSCLARPTTVLAAIPFGVALLWERRARVAEGARLAVAFGAPIAVAAGIYAAFNYLRFGSPFEAGYGLSYITDPSLIARRNEGVFSLRQIPENVRLALLAGFGARAGFPWVLVDPHGLSMLLVSPALLLSLWAGFRGATARLLWIAAALVAIPVFLYYGGGYVQYGFRYSLDFQPFLVALMALGTRRAFGTPEKLLIAASVASVAFGVLWRAHAI